MKWPLLGITPVIVAFERIRSFAHAPLSNRKMNEARTLHVGMIDKKVCIDNENHTFSIDIRSAKKIAENYMSECLWRVHYAASFERMYISGFDATEYLQAVLFSVENDSYVFVGDHDVIKVRFAEQVTSFNTIHPHYGRLGDCASFSFALTANSVILFRHDALLNVAVWSTSRAWVERVLDEWTDEEGIERWKYVYVVFMHYRDQWTKLKHITLLRDQYFPVAHLDLSVRQWHTQLSKDFEVHEEYRPIISESSRGAVLAFVVHKPNTVGVCSDSKADKKNKLSTFLRRGDARLRDQYVAAVVELRYSSSQPDRIMLHAFRRALLGIRARAWLQRRREQHAAARVIQRAWKTAICDPVYAICRKRLMREFQELA